MAGTRNSKVITNATKRRVKDGHQKVAVIKSFRESSKSFPSPNFANKATWFFAATEVTDEVATTSDDTIYNFASGKTVIDLDKVTARKDYAAKGITIKKNDTPITTGFTVDPAAKTITFSSANSPTDVIKVSYSYENGSTFELTASSGKQIKLDYVETQFSAGCTINDTLVFELILNNDSTGNQDYVVAAQEYKSAEDFLNVGNHGSILEPFGELTTKVNIFPWNYLTGFIIKPVGDNTTNPYENEFNKIKMYLKNDLPYTNCEIATGTFYCLIEDL